MGGLIRVVHVCDGEVDKQSRWTNSLPEYVKSDSFIEGDRAYIKEYMQRKSEYRAKREHFAPSGYGLDVFDFDRKEIRTCQGYCDYTEISYNSVRMYFTGNVVSISNIDKDNILFPSPITPDDPSYYPPVVGRMFEKKMVGLKSRSSKIKIPLENLASKDPNGQEQDLSFEIVLSNMELANQWRKRRFKKSGAEAQRPSVMFDTFYIEWEKFGWKVIKYQTLKEMYEDVSKIYTLSNKDKKVWEEEIKYEQE